MELEYKVSAPNKNHGKTKDQWERMCLSKTRYADEYAARAGALHMLNDATMRDGAPQEGVATRRVWRGVIPDALWVYKCTNCRGFHITKKFVPNSAKITAEEIYSD